MVRSLGVAIHPTTLLMLGKIEKFGGKLMILRTVEYVDIENEPGEVV
jgi:hypothetical protein